MRNFAQRLLGATGNAYLLNACLSSVLIFIYLTVAVFGNGSVVNIDLLVNGNIHIIQSGSVTLFMSFITNLLSPMSLPIFSLLLLGWFIKKSNWPVVALIITFLGGGFVVENALKFVIARPRPPIGLIPETDFSFPSGHATLAAIFFLLLIYCFKDEIKSLIWRRLFVALNIFLFLMVGFSRVYLEVHWVSDVLAGFVLGIFWLSLLILALRSYILLSKKESAVLVIKKPRVRKRKVVKKAVLKTKTRVSSKKRRINKRQSPLT